MSMSEPTRVYVVQTIKTGEENLVRAPRATSAKQFVSGNDYRVRVATQRDMERLMTDGARVQEANPEPVDTPAS
jgi:hypothetical protein